MPRVRYSPQKPRAEPPKPEPPPSWKKEDLTIMLVPTPPEHRSANSSSNSRDPRLQKRDITTPKRRDRRCKPIPLEPVNTDEKCNAAKQSVETGRAREGDDGKKRDVKEPNQKQTTERTGDNADAVSGPSKDDLTTPQQDASLEKADSGAAEDSASKQTATVSEAADSSCGQESNNNEQSQVESASQPVTSTALQCIEEFRKFDNPDMVKAVVEKSLELEMTQIESNSEYCDPLHDHTPDQMQQKVSKILLRVLFE